MDKEREFKVGDKVVNVNGESFSNHSMVLTISKVDTYVVWFKETGTSTEKSCVLHSLIGMRFYIEGEQNQHSYYVKNYRNRDGLLVVAYVGDGIPDFYVSNKEAKENFANRIWTKERKSKTASDLRLYVEKFSRNSTLVAAFFELWEGKSEILASEIYQVIRLTEGMSHYMDVKNSLQCPLASMNAALIEYFEEDLIQHRLGIKIGRGKTQPLVRVVSEYTKKLEKRVKDETSKNNIFDGMKFKTVLDEVYVISKVTKEYCDVSQGPGSDVGVWKISEAQQCLDEGNWTVVPETDNGIPTTVEQTSEDTEECDDIIREGDRFTCTDTQLKACSSNHTEGKVYTCTKVQGSKLTSTQIWVHYVNDSGKADFHMSDRFIKCKSNSIQVGDAALEDGRIVDFKTSEKYSSEINKQLQFYTSQIENNTTKQEEKPMKKTTNEIVIAVPMAAYSETVTIGSYGLEVRVDDEDELLRLIARIDREQEGLKVVNKTAKSKRITGQIKRLGSARTKISALLDALPDEEDEDNDV